jgi:8-oxo-dGTP pyrophosphatase MutT (NUDIX family)
MHKNPWKTLSTRVTYENPWIKVREDSVTHPDGSAGIYGVVHFKNIAVGVLAVDGEDIYMVGQFRYPLNSYSWEIPEGGCPEGEEPLEAAKRELEEETGFRAESWEEIGRAHLSNSVSDELAVWYVAKGLQPGRPAPDASEELQIKKIPFDEALSMVEEGQITDALTMLALMSYERRRER